MAETAAPRERPSRALRALPVVGWLLVVPLVLAALARLVAADAHYLLVATHMLSFWLYLPAYAVLPGALLGRRFVLASLSAAMVLLHLSLIVPGQIAAPAPGALDGPRLRVGMANVLYCNERAPELFRELLAARPDVLVVTEHSSRWEALFASPEALRVFPHRIFHSREDAFGIGLYSRLALEDAEIVDVEGVPLVRALVRRDGRALRVMGAHPLPPRRPDYHLSWERQMARIAELAARETGPLVLAGDLNASPYNAWYSRLTAGRLRGAHEERGRGLATTWPNGMFPLPPVRLDHVLVSGELVVDDVREGAGTGSDHLPVFADLRWTRDPRAERHGAAPARLASRPLAAAPRPLALRPSNDRCASR